MSNWRAESLGTSATARTANERGLATSLIAACCGSRKTGRNRKSFANGSSLPNKQAAHARSVLGRARISSSNARREISQSRETGVRVSPPQSTGLSHTPAQEKPAQGTNHPVREQKSALKKFRDRGTVGQDWHWTPGVVDQIIIRVDPQMPVDRGPQVVGG